MKIIIADDHSIIRAALRSIAEDLAPSVTIVEAASFDELRAALASDKARDVSLVVLDLNMPGGQGMASISAVVEQASPVPVVIFSITDDAQDIRACFTAGVRGFVPKSTDHAQLSGILRLVLAGGMYVPPSLALGTGADHRPAPMPTSLSSSRALDDRNPDTAPATVSLTRRQRDVMELLADGLSNNEIGERLGLNLSTVKAHVSGVLRGLGVSSRTQAALRIRQILGRN